MSVSFKKEQIGERISVSAAIFFRLGINSLAFEVIDTRAWCSLALARAQSGRSVASSSKSSFLLISA